MYSLAERKETAERIAEIRRSIKRKHSALTSGVFESEQRFREQFKPLIEPLTKISKFESVDPWTTKTEPKEEPEEEVSFGHLDSREAVSAGRRFRPPGLLRSTVLYPDRRPPREKAERARKGEDDSEGAMTPYKVGRSELDEDMDTTTPEASRKYDEEPMEDNRPSPLDAMRRLRARADVHETPTTPKDVLSTPEGRLMTSMWVKTNFGGPVAKDYVLELINDTTGSSDTVYGAHFGEDGNLWLGDSRLTFDKQDRILVKDSQFPGERGLYELLFKKRPDPNVYSEEDRDDYKRMLLMTNAHRVNYDPDERVNSNSGYKYSNLIKDLLSKEEKRKKPKGGMGLPMVLTDGGGKVDYVYWDDPNELVERLRLLVAERDAGHTGHGNEIVSILEELCERGVIKGPVTAE